MYVSVALTKVHPPRRETSITCKLFPWRLINPQCRLFYCRFQIRILAFMPREELCLGGSEPTGGKHGSLLDASPLGGKPVPAAEAINTSLALGCDEQISKKPAHRQHGQTTARQPRQQPGLFLSRPPPPPLFHFSQILI